MRRGYGVVAVVVVGVVLLVAGAVFAYNAAYKSTQRVVTAKVTDKERVCESGNTSCKYLIFTNKGTFKDTDSFLYGKFRSSDVYGMIQRGRTYVFTVAGWRLPFFSGYPNIVKVQNAS